MLLADPKHPLACAASNRLSHRVVARNGLARARPRAGYARTAGGTEGSLFDVLRA